MSDKPVFSMSKFVNNEDRLQAMATYYRDLTDELELEAKVLTAKVNAQQGAIDCMIPLGIASDIEKEKLSEKVKELDDKFESEYKSHGVTVDQREHWESKATELAGDIGKALGFEVGEHSSDNCPVQNAIDEIYRCGNKYL